MTYDKRYIHTAPITSEELVYSPYADGDDFDASMMGTYTSDRAQPVMSFPHAPSFVSHQNRVMPNYVPPPGYKLVPLGAVDGGTGMSAAKKTAIVVAVIIAIGAIIYYVQRSKKKSSKTSLTPTQAVKKLPTSRLAQNLYARLAKNGGATRGTLAALERIAQE